VLRKQPGIHAQIQSVSLKALYLAGEPLDETTSLDRRRTERADHRQLLADRNRLADPLDRQGHRGHADALGSPGVAMYGYRSSCSTSPPARSAAPTKKAWW
jgi:hypothetical protein